MCTNRQLCRFIYSIVSASVVARTNLPSKTCAYLVVFHYSTLFFFFFFSFLYSLLGVSATISNQLYYIPPCSPRCFPGCYIPPPPCSPRSFPGCYSFSHVLHAVFRAVTSPPPPMFSTQLSGLLQFFSMFSMQLSGLLQFFSSILPGSCSRRREKRDGGKKVKEGEEEKKAKEGKCEWKRLSSAHWKLVINRLQRSPQ